MVHVHPAGRKGALTRLCWFNIIPRLLCINSSSMEHATATIWEFATTEAKVQAVSFGALLCSFYTTEVFSVNVLPWCFWSLSSISLQVFLPGAIIYETSRSLPLIHLPAKSKQHRTTRVLPSSQWCFPIFDDNFCSKLFDAKEYFASFCNPIIFSAVAIACTCNIGLCQYFLCKMFPAPKMPALN